MESLEQHLWRGLGRSCSCLGHCWFKGHASWCRGRGGEVQVAEKENEKTEKAAQEKLKAEVAAVKAVEKVKRKEAEMAKARLVAAEKIYLNAALKAEKENAEVGERGGSNMHTFLQKNKFDTII